MKAAIFCISLVIFAATIVSALHHCDHKIYCEGPIIEHVSKSNIFKDSKSFVDKKLKNTIQETIDNFNALLNATQNNPTKDDIKQFVDSNFEDADELQPWQPLDYKPNPALLDRIQNDTIREFAKNVVGIWPTLGRRVKDEVTKNKDQYSLISLPEGFIVPGGRFKEIYYWDSYWVLEGLLLSDMTETAKGILDNFASLIRKYGYIPNGSRIYYLDRSHPPLFTLMVAAYAEKTRDTDWVEKHLLDMEFELSYWLKYKTVQIVKGKNEYTLAHYVSGSDNPRPESYPEDVETCSVYGTKEEISKCYNELKSAAESGWDFSSRWLFDKKGDVSNKLADIEATRVIPVELNSILCRNFGLLKQLYMLLGYEKLAEFWGEKEEEWKRGIEAVLYNEEDGVWYDYDIKLSRPRKAFYPTNLTPLALGCLQPDVAKDRGCKAAEYLRKNNIDKFAGGIPTSIQKGTGQQWDYPNAWPPLQDGVISALLDSRCPTAMTLAQELAQTWVNSMIVGYQKDKAMYEKYDATKVGTRGGGGEYEVQTGFGWTNGAVLKIINKFFAETSKETRLFQ